MEWLVISVVIIVIGWFAWNYAARNNPMKVGQSAPDFRLPDQQGKIHTLADFQGKWLALYFYPKDDTPGCTKQACTFRDDLHQLSELGAEVIGVSVDDANSHAGFAKKYNLQFPLLADSAGEVTARYHSLINLGLMKFARRNTFLIDPHGRIARIYLSASAGRNSGEIIGDLKQMQASLV